MLELYVFIKKIFHGQSHGCLYSVITSMEGKQHLFWGGNHRRGKGSRVGGEVVGLLSTTALYPKAVRSSSPKIDSHIVLYFLADHSGPHTHLFNQLLYSSRTQSRITGHGDMFMNM